MINIETVERELAHWRTTRRIKKEKIPDLIRGQVIALREFYSDSVISQRLNIRKKQIVTNFEPQIKLKKDKKIEKPNAKVTPTKIDKWVETSLGQLSSPSNFSLKISNPSGHSMEIKLPSSDQLCHLVDLFMSKGGGPL